VKHTTFLVMALLFMNCGSAKKENQSTNKNTEDSMSTGSLGKLALTSTAFKEGETIPKKYTCDGPDISPPLEWESAPANTGSLALIAEDPDAPMGTWVHWVVYDIPPNVSELAENIPPEKTLPDGAVQGKNDFRNIGYGGPCPPSGTHRYYFRLYALDTKLNLPPGSTKFDLVKAMQGHIVSEAQLMGKYSR